MERVSSQVLERFLNEIPERNSRFLGIFPEQGFGEGTEKDGGTKLQRGFAMYWKGFIARFRSPILQRLRNEERKILERFRKEGP